MFAAALCAVPIAFATQVPGMWWAVLLIGLACAGHQGFSANVYALPGDLFPRRMAGSVIGLGGLAGAAGGMLMAAYAGRILETIGSYQPIFVGRGLRLSRSRSASSTLSCHATHPSTKEVSHDTAPASPRPPVPGRAADARHRPRAVRGVKDLPIVSPHGHTDPAWFATDAAFRRPGASC